MYFTYFPFKRRYRTPDTGEYFGYDIAVYGSLYRRPVQIVRDVSANGELIFRIIVAFNENSLSPIHLLDAIQDFLSLE